jgi:hypothetical protein
MTLHSYRPGCNPLNGFRICPLCCPCSAQGLFHRNGCIEKRSVVSPSTTKKGQSNQKGFVESFRTIPIPQVIRSVDRFRPRQLGGRFDCNIRQRADSTRVLFFSSETPFCSGVWGIVNRRLMPFNCISSMNSEVRYWAPLSLLRGPLNVWMENIRNTGTYLFDGYWERTFDLLPLNGCFRDHQLHSVRTSHRNSYRRPISLPHLSDQAPPPRTRSSRWL